MSKVSAFPIGPLFGLGVLSLVACSGAAFGGEGTPKSDPKHTDTTDSVLIPNRGGAGTTTPGGTTATEGGAAVGEPQQLTGGTPSGAGGSAGSTVIAGAGGSVVDPPDQGAAGDPNIPDPPLDPNCVAPLREDWSTAITASGSAWEIAFGDPSIDVANHRLVVTYDDVAARTTAFEGGYYATAEVTLAGGTVLTPYPYAREMVWPSLRRSSNGTSVQLGGTQYGQDEHWSNSTWPGFSGVSIAGTTKVLLTTYIKAAAKAAAVKVSYGSKVYRSGWVSGFTWPDTNLGILRYTGENNSAVYQGDAVYVGPLSGCQKLTDAAIETLFND